MNTIHEQNTEFLTLTQVVDYFPKAYEKLLEDHLLSNLSLQEFYPDMGYSTWRHAIQSEFKFQLIDGLLYCLDDVVWSWWDVNADEWVTG